MLLPGTAAELGNAGGEGGGRFLVQRLLQSGKEREGDDERANAVESTAQREGCDEVVGEDVDRRGGLWGEKDRLGENEESGGRGRG